MSGKQARRTRRQVNKAYKENYNSMRARVLTQIEDNPDFAMRLHYNAINGLSTKWKRLQASVVHAWRLVDRSPVIKLRREEG